MSADQQIASLLDRSRAVLAAKRRARLSAERYVLLRLVPAWLAQRMGRGKMSIVAHQICRLCII